MATSQLRRSLFAPQTRAGLGAVIRNRQQAPIAARRTYAQAHAEPKRSDLPWMVVSVGLTVPAALYLLNSGPQETAHGTGPERPLVKGPKEGSETAEEKQSERDPPDAMKPEKSPGKESGTQSGKQQGVSNDETMHPELYASGKSEKDEGVTDSAKVKGTVSPDRGKGDKK